jgi:DNA-binding MarR family transcriptional regulator
MSDQTLTTELSQQLIDRFWETVPTVWHLVRNQIHTTAVQKCDISVEQFHILRHIGKGVDSVSELATIKHISRPAISQAVNTLVERGLVARSQEAHDRRYVHLKLTATGERLLNEIFQETRTWMSARLAALTDAEIEQVLTGLTLLKRGMEGGSG